MCVVLVFTVKIRTISQLHPFGMFQGLLARFREPALDIHYDDAIIISDAGIRSCIHITMVQPRLRRIYIHAQVREDLCNSPSQNMDAGEHSNINQKPSVLFVGHVNTVDTQTRRHTMRRLIRVSTVCLQNVLSQFE